MHESLEARAAEYTLEHAHELQEREALAPSMWDAAPEDAYCIFMLFNLEAADDMGHCILALGPVNGPFETYSFYRQGTKTEAPALMACLRDPMTFEQLRDANGWIIHGQPGNYWNEHVNTAIAMWCDKAAYEKARAFAQTKKNDPGEYNLITYNCLTFVDEALHDAGIHLRGKYDGRVRTIIPKEAFFDIDTVQGAHRFEAWKYWFDVTEAPDNDLRSISDIPGNDKPLD